MPGDYVGLAKEIFSAWKVWLKTREEAYQRKRDKEQVKAINAGEKYILINKELIATIKEPDKEQKRLIKRLSTWETRFNKYD